MSRAVGAAYERLAAAYLVERGYRVVQRNFTCRGGEIDLICDHAGTLVFVEVRARTGGGSAETVSPIKRRRLVTAARRFLAAQPEEQACRFDVVTVDGGVIEHLPDAFDASTW